MFTKFVRMLRNAFFCCLLSIVVLFFFSSCEEKTEAPQEVALPEVIVEPDMRYGYDFNQYHAKQLKIRRGDTFWCHP